MRAPSRLTVAAAAVAVAVVACSDAAPTTSPEVAEGLAARADAVAERIATGDGCAALSEVDVLRAEARSLAEQGRLPTAAAETVVATADALQARITCPPPEPPAPEPPPPAEDDPEEEDDDRGRGRGEEKRRDKDDKDDDESEDD